MGRYREALADLDRAIESNNRIDWFWYLRALTHLLAGQMVAFESDLRTAIERAQSIIQNAPDDQTTGFNLALYNLIDGNLIDAEADYGRLTAACSSLVTLQDAVDDLLDFLAIQPSHELAQHLLSKLQSRISELNQSSA
jgi:tetratricopeptide (TPR) repeat protein